MSCVKAGYTEVCKNISPGDKAICIIFDIYIISIYISLSLLGYLQSFTFHHYYGHMFVKKESLCKLYCFYLQVLFSLCEGHPATMSREQGDEGWAYMRLQRPTCWRQLGHWWTTSLQPSMQNGIRQHPNQQPTIAMMKQATQVSVPVSMQVEVTTSA